MKSILHKVTPGDVQREPFPHVIVDNALDEELYGSLAETFPDVETIAGGQAIENNTPYRMPAVRLLADARVAACWKEFVREHTSDAFFAEVLSIFGDAIRELHPHLPMLDGAYTNVRSGEPFADVALDCQPCWGAPVTRASSSDPCHIDRPVALFAGLLYCRLPADDSAGGDLELYRFRGAERRYDATRHVDAALVEPVKRIEYAANRLVFFLHSPQSLHGVTVRAVTRWPRLHVNFLAEMPKPIFALEPSRAVEAA